MSTQRAIVLFGHGSRDPLWRLPLWRRYDSMLDEILRAIHSRRLTVLVTHWWEYFRDGEPDGAFIYFLHETAEYLAKNWKRVAL